MGFVSWGRRWAGRGVSEDEEVGLFVDSEIFSVLGGDVAVVFGSISERARVFAREGRETRRRGA